MDLQSDAFFGTCANYEIYMEKIPKNVSIEFLGYYARDNIKVDQVKVSFSSPTWLSHPLQYQGSNIGWTATNFQTYEDGGVHVISQLQLKNPGT